MKTNQEYTVNEFAKLCNTTVRTINHYEELDLIKPHKILENGYRLFHLHQVDQISSIMLYKDYGFSLKQIKEMMTSTSFDTQIHHLNLQKKMIEAQKKNLLEKEERINYILSEIQKASSNEIVQFENISEQHLDITPVLNESDSFLVNYLSNGFRNGVIINPFENRITGFYSTVSSGTKTISGECMCTYMKEKGYDVQAVLRFFKENALRHGIPMSDIYGETIIETENMYLFKYYMMCDLKQQFLIRKRFPSVSMTKIKSG